MRKYNILVERDDTCNMAKVSMNGFVILEGNTHDFHPGVTLDSFLYGNFSSPASLADRIYANMLHAGIDFRELDIVKRQYDARKEN